MKILKIRRGFTTNSSASSEWIPSPNGSPSGTPSNTLPNSAPGTTFTPVTKIVLPMNAQPGGSSTISNLTKGGGLIALVAVIFLADRTVRTLLRRRKAKRGDDDAE